MASPSAMVTVVNSFGVLACQQGHDGWEFLMVRHTHGEHWGFPKGRPERGERDGKVTALREFTEETGLQVTRLLSEEPVLEKYQYARKRDVVVKTVSLYLAEAAPGEFRKPDREISDIRWVPATEILKRPAFPETVETVRQALEQLAKLNPAVGTAAAAQGAAAAPAPTVP